MTPKPELWLPSRPALIHGFDEEYYEAITSRQKRDRGHGRPPATITNITGTDSATDQASLYTFSTLALGTAGDNKWIGVVVTLHAAGARTIDTVTVDGITATLLATAENTNALPAWQISACYIAKVSASTGNIVVDFSGGTCVRCGIGWYDIRNINGIVPTDIIQLASNTTGAPSDTLLVEPGGVAFGGRSINGNGGPRTQTWAGLIEDFDVTIESNASHSCASGITVTGGNFTVTSTASGVVANTTMACVSLR